MARHPRIAITEKLKFAPDFTGSVAWAGTGPQSTVVVNINRITPDGEGIIGTVTFPGLESFLLMEDGSYILLEDGGRILLES